MDTRGVLTSSISCISSLPPGGTVKTSLVMRYFLKTRYESYDLVQIIRSSESDLWNGLSVVTKGNLYYVVSSPWDCSKNPPPGRSVHSIKAL